MGFAKAIKASTNWRSVMLLLGFGDRSRSAGAIRIVRRRAAELNLDWSHFRGKRRWSDAYDVLIPSRAIAGRVRILLRTYKKYIVGNGLLGTEAVARVAEMAASA